MNRIRSVNLDREYAIVGAEVEKEVCGVLRSGKFILGAKGQELENKLAEYCGTNYAVTLANGTDAIRIALLASGAWKYNNVRVPDFTFAATAEAPISQGYTVESCPVTSTDFQMEKVTGTSVVVDLFGLIGWTDRVDNNSYIIVEDAAQAFGATFNGHGIGYYSDVATISFYPTKTLGACGDAGALVTNDRSIAAEAKLLRDHHMSEKYVHSGCGFNSRMDEVQAAILLVKLNHVDEWISRKNEIAEMYYSGLSNLPIYLPTIPKLAKHTFHQFTIRTGVGKREELKRYLDVNGIDSSVFYPVPIIEMPGLNTISCGHRYHGDTRDLCGTVLSLPICPHLTDDEVEMVIETIRRFYNEKSASG